MENAAAAAATSAAVSPATGRDARPSRPALRPLALPTEHGGWGFLFEPLVLGLAVAPSLGGSLVAAAAICAFLSRQPLKLAMQDALRGKSYARTWWCRIFAAAYLTGAAAAIAAAITVSGWKLAIPFAAVAPLAIVTLIFDARNHSRSALPELFGSIAMASTAAAIPLAAGRSLAAAFAVMALIVISRGLPSIVYVRTLLKRAHGKVSSSWQAIALHVIAVIVAFAIGSYAAAVITLALLGRAAYGLTHPVPPAKTLGWREIAWGAVTVGVFALALQV
jgi:YwiC-like protein